LSSHQPMSGKLWRAVVMLRLLQGGPWLLGSRHRRYNLKSTIWPEDGQQRHVCGRLNVDKCLENERAVAY
jgi:hypothetical protein